MRNTIQDNPCHRLCCITLLYGVCVCVCVWGGGALQANGECLLACVGTKGKGNVVAFMRGLKR